jgi:phage terminase large subunit-like protein
MWATTRDLDWPLPDRTDHPFYAEVLRQAFEEGDFALFRETALNDFWFFCRHVLSLGKLNCDDVFLDGYYGKPWLDHPWLFARCRELQANPNGFADIWPRYHFKTALITQSLTMWDLADNPDLRFAIITYKIDTVGEGMLAQIKNECQNNELLKRLFPRTFWSNPEKQSPQWSLDALCMKRSLNPKEPTISFASLKAGLTSFHVHVRVWDDPVTEENVRSTDAIDDTTTRIRNFAGIGADFVIDRFVGTRWAVGDSWEPIIKAGICKLRYHDLYLEDEQTPVLRSKEWCDQMYRHMTLIGGLQHWSCVMRNKPELGGDIHFEMSWLTYYDDQPEDLRKNLNVYLLIDTATAKRKGSDFTVLSVIGLGRGVPLGHYYLLDMVRDRMGLVQMTDHIFRLVEKWRPTYALIEQVAAQRDSEHIKKEMADRAFQFRLLPFEDKMPKVDRIKRLQPVFQQYRFHLPKTLPSRIEGRPVDLVEEFLRVEYRVWTPERPSRYDDVLDNFAMVLSPKVANLIRFPVNAVQQYEDKPTDYGRGTRKAPRRNSDPRLAWAI